MSRGGSSCLASLIADRYLYTARSGCVARPQFVVLQVGKGGGHSEKSSLRFIFFGSV